jgi:signal transduction histidine kinase
LFGQPEQQQIDLTFDDGGNMMGVGRLIVVVDTCSVGEQFLDRAIVSLVSGSLKSLALAGILLIVFYVTLTKPLSTLASQLTNLNLRDHPGDRIQLPEHVDVEELQTIAQATNTHLQLIEEHVQEIDSARHALRNTNEGLEQKIQDRTRSLTKEIEERINAENKLRQALKAAEENAIVKSQFLANMSHELRTPLNAIIGYSEFLTHNPNHFDAEKRQEYLSHIRDSGHHLLTLVNNILDLSRLSAGKMPVNIEKVDVNELTRAAATYLEPLAEKNNNKVILEFNSDVREILTDKVRLKQVLINLVGNAAKFTKNGQITLASSYYSEDKQIICISVKDTGIGIPSETLNSIFDDFTQADSRLNRNFEGSGLGLSIVRETCELLGWKIVVESTLQEGSQFTIKIPAEHPIAA